MFRRHATYAIASLTVALNTLFCLPLAADGVSWSAERSARWLKNHGAIALRDGSSSETTDLSLEGLDLVVTGGVIAPASGSVDDFDGVTVPVDGYASTLRVDRSSLAVVKFDDGTYAKLLLQTASYDPATDGPNTSGFTLVYALSTTTEAR